MAQSVYSVRFMAAKGLTSTITYTCPTGFVMVLRDLDVYNGGELVSYAFYLEGSEGQTIWETQASMAGASYGSWRGRQVFTQGESAALKPGGGTWDCTLSGYLLAAT